MKIYIYGVLSLLCLAAMPLHAMLPPLTTQNNIAPLKLLMLRKPMIQLRQDQKRIRYKPVLKMPDEKLSLTDCIAPRNPNIIRAMDPEYPLTFAEGAEWGVNTEVNMALSELLKQHAINPNIFNKKSAELSRQYDAQFYAGKIAITCEPEVPSHIKDLVYRCAAQMHCFDRILVKSNQDSDETALIHTDMPTGIIES